MQGANMLSRADIPHNGIVGERPLQALRLGGEKKRKLLAYILCESGLIFPGFARNFFWQAAEQK
jgi:hypothetical protein